MGIIVEMCVCLCVCVCVCVCVCPYGKVDYINISDLLACHLSLHVQCFNSVWHSMLEKASNLHCTLIQFRGKGKVNHLMCGPVYIIKTGRPIGWCLHSEGGGQDSTLQN